MTAPLVVLDRGHAGKPANPGDRGASSQHGDRVYREALLTPLYLLALEEALIAGGCDVLPVSSATSAISSIRSISPGSGACPILILHCPSPWSNSRE